VPTLNGNNESTTAGRGEKNIVTHQVLNRDTSVSMGYIQISSWSSKHINELCTSKTTAASVQL
jgi:hypothetical protein